MRRALISISWGFKIHDLKELRAQPRASYHLPFKLAVLTCEPKNSYLIIVLNDVNQCSFLLLSFFSVNFIYWFEIEFYYLNDIQSAVYAYADCGHQFTSLNKKYVCVVNEKKKYQWEPWPPPVLIRISPACLCRRHIRLVGN